MAAKDNFEKDAFDDLYPTGEGFWLSGADSPRLSNENCFSTQPARKPLSLSFTLALTISRFYKNTEKESTFGKDLEFQRLVYLGWPINRWINRFFTLYVFDWLSKVFPMGVVLILITLLLKLITYPMVKKSYMISAKMRVLKPKLEAATAQVYNKPEDQMQKQQAMMAEYPQRWCESIVRLLAYA